MFRDWFDEFPSSIYRHVHFKVDCEVCNEVGLDFDFVVYFEVHLEVDYQVSIGVGLDMTDLTTKFISSSL